MTWDTADDTGQPSLREAWSDGEVTVLDRFPKAAGLAAKNTLIQQVRGKQATICTAKDRRAKYGRYLAAIWINGENVNA